MQSVVPRPFWDPQNELVHLRWAFSGFEHVRLLVEGGDVEVAIRSVVS
jgi:hypothetical protein